MVEKIEDILVRRDGYMMVEAIEEVQAARVELEDRVWSPEEHGDPYDICMDLWGLEPDYLEQLY